MRTEAVNAATACPGWCAAPVRDPYTAADAICTPAAEIERAHRDYGSRTAAPPLPGHTDRGLPEQRVDIVLRGAAGIGRQRGAVEQRLVAFRLRRMLGLDALE